MSLRNCVAVEEEEKKEGAKETQERSLTFDKLQLTTLCLN